MRPAWRVWALSLGLAACGHAKHVEDPAAAPVKDEQAEAQARGQGARDGVRLRGGEVTRSENGVLLATSPAGLLKSGAAKAIQERLGSSSKSGLPPEPATGRLDPATHEALSRFQSAHDLPATGEPDDRTVRALGLDPADVFQAGARPDGGAE